VIRWLTSVCLLAIGLYVRIHQMDRSESAGASFFIRYRGTAGETGMRRRGVRLWRHNRCPPMPANGRHVPCELSPRCVHVACVDRCRFWNC